MDLARYSGMAVRIRTGTGDDAEAVALAHVRAWQVGYEGVVPADFLAAIDLEARTKEWRKNFTEAALDNGTPVPLNLVAEVETDTNGPQVCRFRMCRCLARRTS